MKILTKIFNKITLRDHYKKQYFDLMKDFVESEYKPEVISGKSVTFKEIANFKGPAIFFVKSVNFGKANVYFGSSMTIVPDRKEE